jgi:hypothetical protein
MELKGDDLRRDPLGVRKATLAAVLAKAGSGLHLSEHIEAVGGADRFPRWAEPRYAASPIYADSV